MSFEIKGLKELEKKLNKLAKNAQELDGQHEVPLTELLTDKFVSSNSQYQSAQEMFDSSGFTIEAKEDFEAIPDEEWDQFISSNTSFASWEEMLQAAVAEFARKKLGL